MRAMPRRTKVPCRWRKKVVGASSVPFVAL